MSHATNFCTQIGLRIAFTIRTTNSRRTVAATFATLWLFANGCAAPMDLGGGPGRGPETNVVYDADIRDCSPSIFDSLDPLDVAIVIDISESTRRPTGFDIDGDGAIHRFQRRRAVDRGDSRLAAQIAALRPLVRIAEDHDIRFSIITFSGSRVSHTTGKSQLHGSARDSRVRINLTRRVPSLDFVLLEVLERGSDGTTVFSAGMRRAILSLLGPRDGTRRKIALFMSDSPQPNTLDAGGKASSFDPRMKNAAVRARRHDIVFHTFGLSSESELWHDKTLGQIAGATGGNYHPIENPEMLYCHLAYALSPLYQQAQRRWQNAFKDFRNRKDSPSTERESSRERSVLN